MKLIAFEGIDASGKKTQSIMLYEYLKNNGYKVAIESFPRYNTPIGQLILKSLRKEINLSLEAHHMLYEVDRMDYMDTMNRLEKEKYDFLILDRYTHSNVAFGVANGLSYNWLNILQEYVRKPDIVFLLDLTVEESMRRRKARRDKFETDLEFLNKVRMAYTILAKNDFTIIPLWVEKSSPKLTHEAVISHLKREGLIKWKLKLRY